MKAVILRDGEEKEVEMEGLLSILKIDNEEFNVLGISVMVDELMASGRGRFVGEITEKAQKRKMRVGIFNTMKRFFLRTMTFSGFNKSKTKSMVKAINDVSIMVNDVGVMVDELMASGRNSSVDEIAEKKQKSKTKSMVKAINDVAGVNCYKTLVYRGGAGIIRDLIYVSDVFENEQDALLDAKRHCDEEIPTITTSFDDWDEDSIDVYSNIIHVKAVRMNMSNKVWMLEGKNSGEVWCFRDRRKAIEKVLLTAGHKYESTTNAADGEMEIVYNDEVYRIFGVVLE